MRAALFGLIEGLGGGGDVERTFCFATGSYGRGSPESSESGKGWGRDGKARGGVKLCVAKCSSRRFKLLGTIYRCDPRAFQTLF